MRTIAVPCFVIVKPAAFETFFTDSLQILLQDLHSWSNIKYEIIEKITD